MTLPHFSSAPFSPIDYQCKDTTIKKYLSLIEKLLIHFEHQEKPFYWELKKLREFQRKIKKQHFISQFALDKINNWVKFSYNPAQDKKHSELKFKR